MVCSAFDQEIIVAVINMGLVFVAIQIFIRYGWGSLSQRTRVRNYFLKNTAIDIVSIQ